MLTSTRRLRSSDVERVLKAGVSLFFGSLRGKALVRKDASLHSRFAVVVSKKVAGTAVERNRLRRVAFSLLGEAAPLKQPHDLVLMVGKKYLDRTSLEADLHGILGKLR
jgi:ribonuclease P protein component